MKTIYELKEEQKKLAQQIKQEKKESKKPDVIINGEPSGLQSSHAIKAYYFGKQYRLRHIAYCLLRGKLYDQIEKPKEQKKLKPEDWKKIEEVKNEYSSKEDVHISA